MTVGELRARWRAACERQGIDARDADTIIGEVLARPFSWLLAHDDDEVSDDVAGEVELLLRRRFTREPLQYILGRTEFFGRSFRVDSRALIPRPETELLVEEAIRLLPSGARVVDIGTGSGCIAVTLSLERPDLHVFATDRSVAALALARENSAALGARVRFAACDLVGGFGSAFDAIVSNPPYVPAGDMPGLQTEVRDHEPAMALTPGETGLEAVERILEDAPRVLIDEGPILLEIGFSQSGTVEAMAERFGREATFRDDYAGIPRIAILSALHTGR